MIITCQHCNISYHLDETLLKPGGTKVRCTACKTIFTAYPPSPSNFASQSKQAPAASIQKEVQRKTTSSFEHSDKMEVSDDLARVLEQSLKDRGHDEEDEINHLPSNMVHEIEDEDEDDFGGLTEDNSFIEEDNYNLSENSYDLSGNDHDKMPMDDIELSPEDLDLVKGYKSTKYNFSGDGESDFPKPAQKEKKVSEAKHSHKDDAETLSEEDLDLGLSFAPQDSVSDKTFEKDERESDHGLSDHPVPKGKPPLDEFETIGQDLRFDQPDETPQIDIGAELDFEFKSELEKGMSEDSFNKDLDMELSLDDSDVTDFHPKDVAASSVFLDEKNTREGDGEDLLDIDFEDDFKNEDVIDEKEDLNLEFDSDIDAPKNIAKKTNESELDFNLDLDDDFQAKISDPEKEDDFNLDLNFDDNDDHEVAGAPKEDLDLQLAEDDDFNLKLDFSDSAETKDLKEDTVQALSKNDDFELDFDFGDSKEKQTSDKNEGLTIAKDEDFNLDLDFDDSEEERKSNTDIDSALAKDEDLGLDLDFEGGEEKSKIDGELDFDLGLDEDFDSIKAPSKKETVDEEISFDFNKDDSAEILSESDDLDLSDLQDLLDTNQEKKRETVKADGSGDLDLSDLEDVLSDTQGSQEKAKTPEDDEMELDLDIDSDFAEKTAVSSSGKDFSSELDLSEFEYLSDSDEKSPADDHFDTGDMELEFQVEEKPIVDKVSTSEKTIKPQKPVERSVDETKILFNDTPFTESGEDEEEFDEHVAQRESKSISKPLIFVLILAILLGGGYCVYVLLDGMGIQIPFLSNYIAPKVEDPGNLKLSTEDINSKFIDNATAGRLFVITGKVKSTYSKPRRFIQVTGKLYTKGKKLSKTEIAYAGNVILDADLASMDIAAIKKRLADRFGGDQKAGTSVEPGKTIPFMVVFSDLPKEQLEEFTIEVDKSTEVD